MIARSLIYIYAWMNYVVTSRGDVTGSTVPKMQWNTSSTDASFQRCFKRFMGRYKLRSQIDASRVRS